jgi:phosphonoacetaldehyde hydrolase
MSTRQRPLQAVFFDWAGTTIDHGSCAPTRVFVEIFRRRGIDITIAEARGPMGRAKHEHIAAVAALPRVSALWQQRYGRTATADDVQAMYDDFLPLQKETLAHGSDVLPGIPIAIATLRQWGLKIGSTTGYTRELMAIVAPIAAYQGYVPDALVCSDDVALGRPSPLMNARCAELLGVALDATLIVDDTPVGIDAGLQAGALTVAVTRTGNSLGLSLDEVAALPADELNARLATIEAEFRRMGAHYVLPTVADLPPLVQQLQNG